ncbi:hypothetical protein E3220_12635 [Piscirickettsia salmonis EM-90]|nr:hypothetical protein E3220_12635 [Piscirickettsia salmonis EM-90]
MLELLSHNCKEKASFFLIVFFNLLIVCQKLLIERYNFASKINLRPRIIRCEPWSAKHGVSRPR